MVITRSANPDKIEYFIIIGHYEGTVSDYTKCRSYDTLSDLNNQFLRLMLEFNLPNLEETIKAAKAAFIIIVE